MYASLNAPQRPAKPAQRKDLLFLFFAQDIHRRRVNLRHSQCLVPLSRWPLFRCPPMAGFWCPPRRVGCSGLNRVSKTQLADPAQPLEQWAVENRNFPRIQLDASPDRIIDGLGKVSV